MGDEKICELVIEDGRLINQLAMILDGIFANRHWEYKLGKSLLLDRQSRNLYSREYPNSAVDIDFVMQHAATSLVGRLMRIIKEGKKENKNNNDNDNNNK